MIIIGEKLNSSVQAVRNAIESMDEDYIANLSVAQSDAGADYIDINAGAFSENEAKHLKWMAEVVVKNTTTSISIDSKNHEAILAALKVNKNGKPLINSITDEKYRFDAIAPLVSEFDTSIVALCLDDEGLPETLDDRLKIANSLVGKLVQRGSKPCDIFIDPLVRPVGTGAHYGVQALESIKRIKQEFPEFHIACGLSNISFGIPARKLMNQAFLVAAMANGMDGTILDPLDKRLMSLLLASDALLGRDKFCMNYISHYREGLLEG